MTLAVSSSAAQAGVRLEADGRLGRRAMPVQGFRAKSLVTRAKASLRHVALHMDHALFRSSLVAICYDNCIESALGLDLQQLKACLLLSVHDRTFSRLRSSTFVLHDRGPAGVLVTTVPTK